MKEGKGSKKGRKEWDGRNEGEVGRRGEGRKKGREWRERNIYYYLNISLKAKIQT